MIVTLNTRHFPLAACDQHGVAVQTPDAFLCDAVKVWPKLMATVLEAQAARKQRPPMSTGEMLDRLAHQVPRFVAMVKPLVRDETA